MKRNGSKIVTKDNNIYIIGGNSKILNSLFKNPSYEKLNINFKLSSKPDLISFIACVATFFEY